MENADQQTTEIRYNVKEYKVYKIFGINKISLNFRKHTNFK